MKNQIIQSQPAEINISRLQQFERKKMQYLILGIVFDLVGILTYLIPGFGEGMDLIWAPISGIIYYSMYKGILGAVGGTFSMIEELIPFTDIIPTFTVTWFFIFVIKGDQTQKSFINS